MIEALEDLVTFSEAALWTAFVVFLRIGAMMAMLPAFGEQSVPVRVKLGLGLAFTLIVWPAVGPSSQAMSYGSFGALLLSETITGLFFGFMLRLFVLALQIAGTIAAQSTSLSQLFGGSAGTDPQPAMGHILVVGGLALATIMGLHLRMAEYMIYSYELVPQGVLISAAILSETGLSEIGHAFALGFTLAAPFLVASLIYNLTLGVINKAMPQLMVAFVGAPAITAGGLVLLMLTAPFLLALWADALSQFMIDPFGAR